MLSGQTNAWLLLMEGTGELRNWQKRSVQERSPQDSTSNSQPDSKPSGKKRRRRKPLTEGSRIPVKTKTEKMKQQQGNRNLEDQK